MTQDIEASPFCRVLVVDDSFIMRRLVREIVESDEALQVCGMAENGKAALALVRSEKPDVVLLDIEMPEMSGLETLRRLGLRSPCKVVILSSLVADEDTAERREALRLGAFAAIGKPSGAVSLDIKERRASEIVATVRRAANLPPIEAEAGGGRPADPAPATVAGTDTDAALDLIDTGVLRFDAEGRLGGTNAAAVALLGAAQTRHGSRADEIFTDYNAAIADLVWDALGAAPGAEPHREEIDLSRPDGSWTPLRVTVARNGAPAAGGATMLLADITRERRMKALLDRTLSSSVAEQMIGSPPGTEDGDVRTVSVLFADLRGFTQLSEALGAAGMVRLLNDYFSFMADVIREGGGVIDKYIGDAIMALFGAPLSHGDDAARAMRAARDMMRALALFNAPRLAAGEPPVAIGIGLATGPVIAGAIGSPDRLNYTVIGDAVNLASRLESRTKSYGASVVACGETVRAAGAAAGATRLIDRARVVGQDRATEVHEVRMEPLEAQAQARFLKAMALYREGAFTDAGALFETDAATDGPSRLLAARARRLALDPPAAWDGVWTLTEK